MKTLIDGYNLIFECGLQGKRVNNQSLARARERMLRTLASIFPETKSEITVVFDAQKQMLSGQQERDVYLDINVMYSIRHSEADELIAELITQHSAPKMLTVVSSDHKIQKAAARRKAKFIDSGDWWDQIHKLTASKKRAATKPAIGEEKCSDMKLLSDDEIERLSSDVDYEVKRSRFKGN